MVRNILASMLVAGLLISCGFKRKKYDNPITKDTKQPDKVLFDRSINDIEHGRYEVARITLNTLINTYDQSEYLAKAKLAIADSWFREGGAHGLAQAEAEYKDFILFYPTMEEAAESQEKICMIHYKQMEKADRDSNQAYRAEEECRTLITQFPNSKFVPDAQQYLRNIQEAIAQGEFSVGAFYLKRGSNPAAANRLNRIVDQYPLFSKADEALWDMGDAYSKMGTRFRSKAGEAYARIVRDYPLSSYVDSAKKRLNELELPVPEADRAAYDRMKWEQENRQKKGMLAKSTELLRRGPDVHMAARSGNPTMTAMRPTVPASVPVPAGSQPGFTGDVTAAVSTDTSALQNQPDARMNPPAPQAAGQNVQPATATPAEVQPAAVQPAAGPPAAGQPAAGQSGATPAAGPTSTTTNLDTSLPTNAQGKAAKELKKKKVKKGKQQQQATPAPPPAAPSTQP